MNTSGSVNQTAVEPAVLPPAAAADFNPYQPPSAAVDVQGAVISKQWLYVVAPRKFLLMMILTLGFYSLYWFYKNWALLNQHHKIYWPVPRAIFSVFFTHALFTEVDGLLRKRGVKFRWSPGTLATVYVVAAIASRVLDRLAGNVEVSPWVALTSTLMLVPMTWALYSAQRAINAAEQDPAGDSNSDITAANILWMLLGALLWAMVLLGLWVMLVNPEFMV